MSAATRRYALRGGPLQSETLVALLGEFDFDAFEEVAGGGVDAYLPEPRDTPAHRAAVEQLAERFGLTVTVDTLADENWNARWEESFAPVEIGRFLRIRAPFHEPDPRFAHELAIEPEMSFGTGHHETTHLMAEYLRDYPPAGKTCFDFGTGTGILALLAKRLGAARVVATDVDPRCVRSTRANAARNGIALDAVSEGSEADLPAGPFGLVLANINRSVLVASMGSLTKRLGAGGELWLSGVLHGDAALIDESARRAGLRHLETRRRGDWLARRYAPKV